MAWLSIHQQRILGYVMYATTRTPSKPHWYSFYNLNVLPRLIMYGQNTDCLLCPRGPRDPKRKGSNHPTESYLRACKPTEGQGWAHILCSVFIPELSFTDPTLLQKVEGVSVIPHHRWETVRCQHQGILLIFTRILRYVRYVDKKEEP